jgi:hypothetical protein
MKKETLISTSILIIQSIIMLLPWLGIQPPIKPTNFFSKIYAFLFFRISFPVIVIIFVMTIIIIYFKFRNKMSIPAKIDNKVLEIKKEEKNEESKLTREHNLILYQLLNSKDCSERDDVLKGILLDSLKKSTADFNILRQELIERDLIKELKSYQGYNIWRLTPKGLKFAKEIHNSIKKIDMTGHA